MYAPSRQGGREPFTTSHSVGGSSSTGAKLLERTYLGSTEDLRGGSMKVFTKSSNALKITEGNDGSRGFLEGIGFIGKSLFGVGFGGEGVGFSSGFVLVVVVVVDGKGVLGTLMMMMMS